MNWKNRLTNYNFWISIVSAILLICQAFKIEFDVAYVNEIATAVLGLLVVIGIISDPTKVATKQTKTQTVKDKKTNEVLETINDQTVLNLEPVENEVKETENAENKEDLEPANNDQEILNETISVPIEPENENASNNIEDNLQTIVEKISTDLKEETKKTELIETDLLNLIKQIIKTEVDVQKVSLKEDDVIKEDDTIPISSEIEISKNEVESIDVEEKKEKEQDKQTDEVIFKIVNN